MFTFIASLHVVVAVALVFMVLVQDSKGGAGGGMFGGGGSQSILGATGAATLFQKMTTWLAIVFAVTCMSLTVLVAHRSGSLLEGAAPPPAKAPVAPAVPPVENTVPAAGATTGTVQAPADKTAPKTEALKAAPVEPAAPKATEKKK